MSLPEVIPIRGDEVKQKKIDTVSAYLSYVGRADFFALTSQPKWQIFRRSIKDGVESIDYADWRIANGGSQHKKGEFAFIWDNRATYFPTPDVGGPIVDPGEEGEDGVSEVTIFHLSMPSANTEYSYALPANTKRFTIQTKSFKVQLAYAAGDSTTDFWTVQRNNWYSEDNIIAENLTLYMQSPNPGIVVEIKSWK